MGLVEGGVVTTVHSIYRCCGEAKGLCRQHGGVSWGSFCVGLTIRKAGMKDGLCGSRVTLGRLRGDVMEETESSTARGQGVFVGYWPV
jgi:hypothetical protein